MSKNKSDLTAKEKEAIRKRDGNMCLKCGRKDSLHVHHIIELYKGGTDHKDNLSTLCSSCHQEWHGFTERNDLSYEDWLKYPCSPQLVAFVMTMENLVAKGEDIQISEALEHLKNLHKLLKEYPLS